VIYSKCWATTFAVMTSGRVWSELDPRNTAFAEEMVRAAGLDQVEVVTADASITVQYRGMVPADLVLACGAFATSLTRISSAPSTRAPRCAGPVTVSSGLATVRRRIGCC
jgi:hypothetical protein